MKEISLCLFLIAKTINSRQLYGYQGEVIWDKYEPVPEPFGHSALSEQDKKQKDVRTFPMVSAELEEENLEIDEPTDVKKVQRNTMTFEPGA